MKPPIPTFQNIYSMVQHLQFFDLLGQVRKVTGLIVESDGPSARMGDLCLIEPNHLEHSRSIAAEVVGFQEEKVLLMPLDDLAGIKAGCWVKNTGGCLKVPVGKSLLGRVLNGFGQPLDNGPPLELETYYPAHATPPSALSRKMIQKPFYTGVRSIDGLLTMGVGQRVGIFAGSGVGKSTLLGMIARNGDSDVNVVALIGERGREVREFIENDLGPSGMSRSVVVYATSDEPAMVRIKAAMAATAIAEFFRDQGLNVLLMMDSVTRLATAQREIGLAAGEPPSTKGYTPSVFALLPKLMERTGCSSKGAITAIYTVLVDGDDTNEPVADAVRSILDGHIVLDRKLSNRGHYPPIDILQSLSRLMNSIADAEHIKQANHFRELYAAYNDVEDLVHIGAYQSGANPLTDKSIANWEQMKQFLVQPNDKKNDFKETLHQLGALTTDA